MLTRLIPLLTFFLASRQQCVQGCLKCSTGGTCLFCDVPSGYFLSNGRCFQATSPNCQVAAQDSSCYFCAVGYYIDPNTRKCVAVPEANLITGCAVYNQFYACVACTTGYFLNLGNCTAANVTIPNCASQDASGACLQCNSGYLPTYYSTACVQMPTGLNCLSFSYVTCLNCQPGFVANPNLYLSSFYSFTTISQLISAPSLFSTIYPANVCQQGTIPNCLNYTNLTNCSVCASGYYLQNGLCTQFQQPAINDCAVYSSATVCTRRVSGFNLISNACVPVTPVPNCFGYDGASPVASCVQCVIGMYLSGVNACTRRIKSSAINACQVYSPTSDTCATCLSGYILTVDSLNCLPVYDNCLTYSVQSSFYNPTCVLCPPGYYPIPFNQTNTCALTSVPGCAQANYQNPSLCSICQNGYYIVPSTGNCVPHLTIKNCAQYSPSVANVCTQCAPGMITLQISNYCQTVAPPAACASFNSVSGCTACINGFYLSNGSCAPIPVSWGPCVSAPSSAVACGVCAPGNIMLSQNGLTVCTAFPDYLTPNCLQMNPSLSSANFQVVPPGYPSTLTTFCSQCVVGGLPYFANPLDALCINSGQLQFYASFATIYGCLRYGLTSSSPPSIVCMECQSGYFISGYWNNINLASPIACVLGCPVNGKNVVLFDDFFGFRNICVVVGTTVAQINLPPCSYMARFQVQQQGVWTTINANILQSDWRCASPSQNSFLWLDLNWYAGQPTPSVFFPLAASSSPTSVNQATADFFPFSTVDTSPSPSILNMRAPIATPRLFSSLVLTSGQTSASFANCKYVMSYQRGSIFASGTGFTNPGSTFDTCLGCSFGYQITYTVTSSSGNPPYTSCATMGSACTSPSTVIGGLMSAVAAMVSCHTCAQSFGGATYPTIWMEQDAFSTTGNAGYILQFSLPTIVGNVANPSHGFRCQAAPGTVTVGNAIPPTNNQVSNCAVFGVFTAITVSQTPSFLTNGYCLACASGYYPRYFGAIGGVITGAPNYVPTYVVTQCVASANCNTNSGSQAFNSCPKCSTAGQSLNPAVFYAYTDNTLVNCVAVTTPNCLIVSSSGSTVQATGNTCAVCQAGYYLNADNYCDFLTIPNAATGATFTSGYYASVLNWGTTIPSATNDALYTRVHYLLSFNNNPYGVSGCKSGYIQAPPPNYATIVCLPSQYLTKANGAFGSSTAFISKCSTYFGSKSGGTANYLCSQCLSGYIPNNLNTACVASVLNCTIAQSSAPTLCFSCAQGFFNVNGVCINSTIANCVGIATKTTTPSLAHTCATCQNGYYLSSDSTSCLPGSIPNCATYSQNSSTGCLSCIPNYIRLTLAGNVLMCLSLNGLMPTCRINDGPSYLQSSVLSCSDCYNTPSAYYTLASMGTPATQPLSVCVPHPLIDNCAVYSDTNALMTLNSFKCLSCNAGYFLNQTANACFTRVNLSPICLSYSPTSDSCVSCSSGFYPDTVSGKCLIFPSGMPGCVAYSGNNVCTNCTQPYFLTPNATCGLSIGIPNCAVYQANNSCTACVFGYFLANQTACIVPNATNCLAYVNQTACAACPPNYGLVTLKNITHCFPTNVSNCANSTQVSPFTCLNCNLGFYLNNGVCKPVVALLPNCLGYDSATTCTACSPGYLLSANRTGCSSSLFIKWGGAGCANINISSTPVCTACQPGYLFVNGVCTGCSSFLLSSGCAACDPANQTACLWCQSGSYYMGPDLACHALLASNNSNNNSNTTNYTTSSAHIFSVLFALVLSAAVAT